MGKTEGKRCAIKRKETEEQLPKRDYKEAVAYADKPETRFSNTTILILHATQDGFPG